MKINILTHSFIDPYNHSGSIFLGGSERYTRDLAYLLYNNGYEVEVHQPAKDDFYIKFEDIPIHGYSYRDGIGTSIKKMIYKTNNERKIFISWFTSQLFLTDNFICINHGIDWDFPEYMNKSMIIRNISANLKKARGVVSVDTNFINWARTIYADETNRINYIPNYADENIFFPRNKSDITIDINGYDKNKLTIVYPRRICRERGTLEMTKVAEKLLNKYNNIQIVFVGEGHYQDEVYKQFINWKKNKPVIHVSLEFDEMYKAYQMADIVVIPTQYAEGTSLSCLEAMSMKKAIVATNIGGLCNLILPDFNGKLVNRDSQSIYNAICELIENESKRNSLAENAYKVSKSFTKEIWEKRWLEFIKMVFN